MRYLFFIGLICLMTSCGSRPSPVDVVSQIEPAAPAAVLEVGDRIAVDVLGHEAYSGRVDVTAAGEVALPGLQNVPAAGRTTDELSRSIRSILVANAVVDPQVSVRQIAQQPFFIAGAVDRPGSYPFRSGLTLEAAIAEAGGYTGAGAYEIMLTRSGAGDATAVSDVAIQVSPGDRIELRDRTS